MGYSGKLSILRDYAAGVARRIQTQAVIRFETEMGWRAQVDWKEFGEQTVDGRETKLYAFVMVLGYSRKPFVCFTTSMDQATMLACHVHAFAYFGGIPHEILYDNMRTAFGPDAEGIWQPTKRLLALAAHYGFTPRHRKIRRPETKGKVERIVQVVREMWCRITALHPAATIDELNELARQWSLEEYGRAIHGTTGIAPRTAFDEIERSRLRPLPVEPFVAASWTRPLVHPDQFITVGKKLYGLPAALIGKRVDAWATRAMVEIYFDHKLVRGFPVPAKGRAFLSADFPDYGTPFVPGAYASSLIIKAGE